MESETMAEDFKKMKKEVKILNKDYGVMEVKYKEELKKRKKLHNMIEDMKGKIRVFCRVRPMNKKEKDMDCETCMDVEDEMTMKVTTKNGPKKFNFDSIFGENSTQEEVYDESNRTIQSAIDGFNVCIFAYGQTGSGKTYTIQGTPEQPGLTPRIFQELYSLLDDMDNYKVELRCYMVELYLEHLADLLHKKGDPSEELEIKENAHGQICVAGANEIKIDDLETAERVFEYGLENRKTAKTEMNDTSSRSHLVFSIIIESKNIQTGQKTIGKLSLVDLAGSERAAKTGAKGQHLKEATAINKSLSALGNVISILGENKKQHVPYRDNKLTMLMKDSLGGNAKTLMFVNVSPADYNCDESYIAL